ncbi:unnamed protein product [Callosobruchus maculatus]|uniref:Uncharacterized protein n=1 Tax=Callosobruchus maculatus TaxID=64391 RepID=A0A653D476_CALMS|nr:unnamed protein product [Callosobruchus maculatus]
MHKKPLLKNSFITAFCTFVNFSSNIVSELWMFLQYVVIQRSFICEFGIAVNTSDELLVFTRYC